VHVRDKWQNPIDALQSVATRHPAHVPRIIVDTERLYRNRLQQRRRGLPRISSADRLGFNHENNAVTQCFLARDSQLLDNLGGRMRAGNKISILFICFRLMEAEDNQARQLPAVPQNRTRERDHFSRSARRSAASPRFADLNRTRKVSVDFVRYDSEFQILTPAHDVSRLTGCSIPADS
jgi:hypothetical protein